MKRQLVRLFAMVVLGLLVTFPAWGTSTSSQGTDDETEITDYRANFTVAANGDLDVTEKINVDFPDWVDKHGIFRFFDTHDPSAPHARRIPQDIRVNQDGLPATIDLSWKDHRRERVVRIGDPDRTVSPGVHVYVISYRIPHVLEKGQGVTGATQFYWNLIPPGWAQRIDHALLHVTLPAAASSLQCTVGVGTGHACTVTGQGTSDVTIRASDLAPQTPVTIKAGLDIPTPSLGTTLPWTGTWDPVLGRSIAVPIVVGLLTIAAAGLGVVLSARAREANPGFPLQYAPPDGIGPAQGNYLRTESIKRTDFVASIMQAAEKGAVSLTHDGDAWTITDSKAGWQTTDEVTQEVYRLIDEPGGSFTAQRKSVADGKKLQSAIKDFDTELKSWALKAGLMSRSALGSRGAVAITLSFALVVVLILWNPASNSSLALIPGAFGIFGLGLGAGGAATKRTKAGRDLWSRVGGFHRVLSTPSSEARFEFSGRKELYTAYLPWAVAFGCAEAWAEKYRTEMGAEPPVPSYFGAYAAGQAGSYVSSMVDSFNETVDSAVSAYEATQSSSGGGGFSGGGGGGGGGGGSW